MILKCRLCKREFDTMRQLAHHERTAHPEGRIQFIINQTKKKVGTP